MPLHKIILEYKDRHLTRPMLDGIIGASLRTNPDAKEIIIRCRSAAQTAKAAVGEYGLRVEIIADE